MPRDIFLGEMLNNVPPTRNRQWLSWGLRCGHGDDLVLSSQCDPIPETWQWSFTETTVRRRWRCLFGGVSFFLLQLGAYSWWLFLFSVTWIDFRFLTVLASLPLWQKDQSEYFSVFGCCATFCLWNSLKAGFVIFLSKTLTTLLDRELRLIWHAES